MKREYTIDNFDVDVGNLHQLLGAAADIMREMDYGNGPTRNHTLDRAAALVDIGRDMAERMLQKRSST